MVADVVVATLGTTSLSNGASTTFDAWSTVEDPTIERGRLRALGHRR